MNIHDFCKERQFSDFYLRWLRYRNPREVYAECESAAFFMQLAEWLPGLAAETARCGFKTVDRAVRKYAASELDAVRAYAEAATLRALREIVDIETARAAAVIVLGIKETWVAESVRAGWPQDGAERRADSAICAAESAAKGAYWWAQHCADDVSGESGIKEALTFFREQIPLEKFLAACREAGIDETATAR